MDKPKANDPFHLRALIEAFENETLKLDYSEKVVYSLRLVKILLQKTLDHKPRDIDDAFRAIISSLMYMLKPGTRFSFLALDTHN